MTLKMLALTVLFSQISTFATACVDDYNEGKSYYNQAARASQRANELQDWVIANDSSLNDAKYCEYMTEIMQEYNDAHYLLRKSGKSLSLALEQCTGSNKEVVSDVMPRHTNSLQMNSKARTHIQQKLYEYCS